MTQINNGKIVVTPELAQELLTECNNSFNRELKEKLVNSYTADMLSGNWHYNGDPIRITKSGNLVDGQHRLKAVVKSGKSIDVFFITDLDDEVAEGVRIFEVIDQKLRAPYEILKIEHKEVMYPKEVVELMKRLSLFNDKAVLKPVPTLSNKDVLAFAEFHQPLKRLDDAVERGVNLSKRGDGVISRKEYAFLAITLGSCERGASFLEELAVIKLGVFGGVLDLTNPLVNLTINLRAMASSKLKGANTAKDRFLLMFKAYDLFVKDEEVKEGYVYSGNTIYYPEDYEFYTF